MEKKFLQIQVILRKNNLKFNQISKSSAAHNVLIVDDNSSCKFIKNSVSNLEIKDGLKINIKKLNTKKMIWKIIASHDGYLKKI